MVMRLELTSYTVQCLDCGMAETQVHKRILELTVSYSVQEQIFKNLKKISVCTGAYNTVKTYRVGEGLSK
jgi:hypothetical protein